MTALPVWFRTVRSSLLLRKNDSAGKKGYFFLFHHLFGGPPRKPESQITERHMDLARSIQEVTEDIMLRMVRHVHKKVGGDNLCLAGGVALNCVANGRILREGPFKNIWIQPAAGDAGGALGSRSIIGDARSPQMQEVMNLKIKFRESFRFFTPDRSSYWNLRESKEFNPSDYEKQF